MNRKEWAKGKSKGKIFFAELGDSLTNNVNGEVFRVMQKESDGLVLSNNRGSWYFKSYEELHKEWNQP